MYTAHGNLEAALNMHLLGPLLFALVAAATVYLAVSVVSGYRVRITLSPRVRRIAFWSVAALFTACWIVKLVFMRGTW
jgi:thiosulfate reductase cytochrome b subunit